MSTPAGWYDDGQGQTRYWDGTAWTEHVAPPASQPPAPVPSAPAAPQPVAPAQEQPVAPAQAAPPAPP
ncbi:MAG: DUF2510 domain-containing protein, partial [Microbacterium sp.]